MAAMLNKDLANRRVHPAISGRRQPEISLLPQGQQLLKRLCPPQLTSRPVKLLNRPNHAE